MCLLCQEYSIDDFVHLIFLSSVSLVTLGSSIIHSKRKKTSVLYNLLRSHCSISQGVSLTSEA